MKNIDTKTLTDDQYQDLENIIDTRLALNEEYGIQDLKVDQDGVVYAPTECQTEWQTHEQGHSEKVVEFTNYKSIYNLLTK